MVDDEFQMVLEAIRQNVAAALDGVGMGAKPFAKAHGMGETVVRDLVKSHNKDVQLGTLAKIARGSNVPLVDLLRMPSQRVEPPTRQALERAIADALPGLPRASGKRAEYLAATVAAALQLPEGLRDDPANDETIAQDAREGDALAPSPTK